MNVDRVSLVSGDMRRPVGTVASLAFFACRASSPPPDAYQPPRYVCTEMAHYPDCHMHARPPYDDLPLRFIAPDSGYFILDNGGVGQRAR